MNLPPPFDLGLKVQSLDEIERLYSLLEEAYIEFIGSPPDEVEEI